MPVFRLIHSLAGDTLTVSFGMTPPGQTAFHPVASGTLHRSALRPE
jgi:hypothetical protein